MATEKRLIRYDGLKQEIIDFKKGLNPKNTDYATGYFSALSVVEGMMVQHITEETVEVVHGEWTIIEDDYCGLIGLECSHCEKTWWFDEESPIGEYHFCPGCGADMRESKEND